MASFDFLGSEQTIFSNPNALDINYVPKLLPHREEQQTYVATAIKPLFYGRSGKTLLVKGVSGIGKTACVRRVIMDLDDVEEADNIARVFINCWKANTTYKVAVEIAHGLGYKFTHNMSTAEIFDKISELLKKRDGLVLVLDEIDKADDYDFLYNILEEDTHKTLIVITNDYSWGGDLDPRIGSRMVPETLEFKPYSPAETEDILRERKRYAFYENTWTGEAFKKIAIKAARFRDVRVGVMLLKAAGEVAEDKSSKQVLPEHAEKAIQRTEEFKIKSSSDLTDDQKVIVEICKEHSGKTTGVLYALYLKSGGKKSEKTFKRNLDKLANKQILALKMTGEKFSGRSSIVTYLGFEKKLNEF